MQKVVGSSPISRSPKSPANRRFSGSLVLGQRFAGRFSKPFCCFAGKPRTKNPATFVKTYRFAGKQNRRPSASGAEAPARRPRARPRSVKARPSTLAPSPKCSKPSSPTTASEAGASSPRPTEAAIGASRRERELVLVCASAVLGGSSRSGRFARKASLVPALPRRAGPNFAADVVPAQDDKQHWPPTCFEEKQGTSPLLLPLRTGL